MCDAENKRWRTALSLVLATLDSIPAGPREELDRLYNEFLDVGTEHDLSPDQVAAVAAMVAGTVAATHCDVRDDALIEERIFNVHAAIHYFAAKTRLMRGWRLPTSLN